jgi:hypothetical protein
VLGFGLLLVASNAGAQERAPRAGMCSSVVHGSKTCRTQPVPASDVEVGHFEIIIGDVPVIVLFPDKVTRLVAKGRCEGTASGNTVSLSCGPAELATAPASLQVVSGSPGRETAVTLVVYDVPVEGPLWTALDRPLRAHRLDRDGLIEPSFGAVGDDLLAFDADTPGARAAARDRAAESIVVIRRTGRPRPIAAPSAVSPKSPR